MISRRGLETATALLTGGFGAAVAISSLANGIGWSSAGVDPGTFPFLTGLIILGGSLFNLVRGWLGDRDMVIGWGDLKRSAGLFVPAVLYVAAIPLLGMTVASGVYVFGTLAIENRLSFLRAGAIAVATSVALYLIFERMFQVALPHGVLADALGL